MVLLHSDNVAIGAKIPDFSLPTVDDKIYALKDFSDAKALLIAFICNHCPYVRAIEDRLIRLAHSFKETELAVVAICANDAGRYPDDSKQELYQRWLQKNYGFPYLIDEDQEITKKFGAVCTPDLFLYDQNRMLYYHGRIDDNWREESKVTKEDLKEAIHAIIKGEPAPLEQHSSMGCSIKWKH